MDEKEREIMRSREEERECVYNNDQLIQKSDEMNCTVVFGMWTVLLSDCLLCAISIIMPKQTNKQIKKTLIINIKQNNLMKKKENKTNLIWSPAKLNVLR